MEKKTEAVVKAAVSAWKAGCFSHDPKLCADPSGWRPEACTCALKDLRKALKALGVEFES